MRHYNESGAVIDTVGKEELLIDQLIHAADLCGAHPACQVLWGSSGAETKFSEVVAGMRSWLA